MRKRKVGGNSGAAIARLRAQLLAALRAHLAGGGKPRVPLAGVPIWQAFAALSAGRAWGEAGAQAILPGDLEAWARVMRAQIPPHHAELIFALDAAWLEWVRTPEAERVVGELTGAAFDAVLG